ncbi:MAG: hypothetical protein E6Q59_00375 [Nitrosomonas sp.]|nr:MAG: hypothetical protein E6Q59_00375 [Nitrosomonas sp.]
MLQEQKHFGVTLKNAADKLRNYEPRSWFERWLTPFVPKRPPRKVSNELAPPPKLTHSTGNWKTRAIISNMLDQVPGLTAVSMVAKGIFESSQTFGSIAAAALDPVNHVAGLAAAVTTGTYLVAPMLRGLLAYSTAALYLANKTGYTAIPIPDPVAGMAIAHIARHQAANAFDWLQFSTSAWTHYAWKYPKTVLTATASAIGITVGTTAAIYHFGLPPVKSVQTTIASLSNLTGKLVQLFNP